MANRGNRLRRVERIEAALNPDPDGVEIVIYDPSLGAPEGVGRDRILLPDNGRDPIGSETR
jgi:hypothetical protein